MHGRAHWVSFALLLSLVLPETTRARPPRRVSLQYTRDERAQACIDPVSLAHKVEAFTGPVLVAPSSAEVALEAHIQARENGGFRARIQIGREGENAHGERVLETDSPDCRSFDDALSFVIATTIDPDLVLERVSALFDPTATPAKDVLLDELASAPVAVAVTERAPVREKPKPLAQPRVTESRALAGVVGVGLNINNELFVRGVGPAVLARLRLRRWLAIGVGAHATFALSDRSVDGIDLRRQELSASFLVCPKLPLGARVELAGCVGPELFLLHVAGRGYRRGSLLDTGLLFRPELSVRSFGPYSLHIAASARFGGQKTLTYSSAQGIELEAFHTPLVVIAGELSVSRVF